MLNLLHVLRVASLFVFAVLVNSCSTENLAPTETDAPLIQIGELVPNQYIVVYNDIALASKESDVQSMSHFERLNKVNRVTTEVLADHEISQSSNLTSFGSAIHGFLAVLSNSEVSALKADKRIKYIEQDRIVSLPTFTMSGKPTGGGTAPTPAQVTPWGITRVGGFINATGSVGGVWIVDTGIDMDHPDLNVNSEKSRSFVTRVSSPDDGNGHGTHVAGTIAAIDNDFGVVGVASGATVISMRVLDKRGTGQFSWSIKAFEHIYTNGAAGDVVNYSVAPGARYVSAVLDDAVTNLSNKGIKVCLAAGNLADDCTFYSPARANGENIFTVSAMDAANLFAYFSNYGAPVDYCEPGVGVLSCYKNGGYATLSGTSMASPHAAGILVAEGAITAEGFVNGDPDGNADPIGVR